MEQIRVLLAEEHRITRQGIRRLLEERDNIQVVGEVDDGDKAVKMALELNPDVVVMGIAMPLLNGIEATRQIKLLCPTTAVLILSAYDDDDYVFSLLDIGVAGYLLKTTAGDDLIHAIEAVKRGEPVLDHKITSKLIQRFTSSGSKPPQKTSSGPLSDREMEVIKLAAKGMSNQVIADTFNIGRRTVDYYMRSIFNKMGVGSRTEAVVYGLKNGWFDLAEIS